MIERDMFIRLKYLDVAVKKIVYRPLDFTR